MNWLTEILSGIGSALGGAEAGANATNYGTSVADSNSYLQPAVDGIGPPQQMPMESPQQGGGTNPYLQGAMRAGTLGAGPIQGYAQAQQMAQQNPLPGLFSMAKAMDDPLQKAMSPQYQNQFINQLLRYL